LPASSRATLAGAAALGLYKLKNILSNVTINPYQVEPLRYNPDNYGNEWIGYDNNRFVLPL